jgi:hypothetical protein
MKKKPYQCSYEDISCDQLDGTTLTLDCGSCENCEHYNNGVKFSKGISISWKADWHAVIWLAILIFLLFLISSCTVSEWNEPGSLRRFNKNHGKVVHNIYPGMIYTQTNDTISFFYVLIDPETNKYSEIKILNRYCYYNIGDTLP